ncbi:sigma-70 family RNA polymerase sigma factor [Pseudalkalibacillus caeni]|uniref:Sigma-70 family RNA polymerase sigma factor n=2 Tax=Exobacillus caeni TaxID=2574798 RepID=A0A5R9F389_9BACL|nr:sigma-70 family RNA polymerase sigma factor [Pseudalkalibacillus caeni]
MDEYGEEIKRLVYTYVKNWAQTDDITQDVFVTLYLKIENFRGESALRSWIYSIAINKCKDYLRSWHYRKIKLTDEIIKVTRSSNQSTPETELELQDKKSELSQLVLSLPLKYREVIILFYYKDLSIKEICSVLNEKESTIKTRLRRARESLKKLFPAKEGSEQLGR